MSRKSLQFVQDLVLQSESTNSLTLEDVHDDLKREAAFLQRALKSAVEARKKILKAGLSFGPPEGLFCEMLKTQEQMKKITDKLESDKKEAKELEEIRKQRQLKKFSKQVQQQKLDERQKEKADLEKNISLIKKRKRISAKLENEEDDFDVDVDVEEAISSKKKNTKARKIEKPVSGKRAYKDQKFGFGGKKSGSKRNTKESTDDFEFNNAKNRAPFKGMRNSKNIKRNRPGKQRRQNMRNKKNK